MSLRVTIYSEVKAWECRSRRETESEQGEVTPNGVELYVVDPKPSDLVTRRLKAG